MRQDMRKRGTHCSWENNIKPLEEKQTTEVKQELTDRQTGFHLTAIINIITRGTFPGGNQQSNSKYSLPSCLTFSSAHSVLET
jgi:hypothetical protein